MVAGIMNNYKIKGTLIEPTSFATTHMLGQITSSHCRD
jgi:hypothetical protein